MPAELKLSTDTQVHILANRPQSFSLLKTIMAIYFQTTKMFACIPLNLYQRNNEIDTSERHKDFHSSVICSKWCKYKCKINILWTLLFFFLILRHFVNFQQFWNYIASCIESIHLSGNISVPLWKALMKEMVHLKISNILWSENAVVCSH